MIGLIDADLLAQGKSRFPNLALMKISSYWKTRGEKTRLIMEPIDAGECTRIFMSKVFTQTPDPDWIGYIRERCQIGGTGYFFDKAPPLDNEIEHSKPDYDLYASFVDAVVSKERKIPRYLHDFIDAGVGFTTRGCFRQCPFCVNQNKRRVEPWSPVAEFDDESRKYLLMLDDNILGYPKASDIFEELIDNGKPFQYKQGMDMRIMTPRIAQLIEKAHYHDDPTFALDKPDETELFCRKAAMFREHCSKQIRAYLLTGFYEQGEEAVLSLLRRIDAISKYRIIPYVMRYETCYKTPWSTLFSSLSAWCNQPQFVKKKTFMEFLAIRPVKSTSNLLASITNAEIHALLNKRYFE